MRTGYMPWSHTEEIDVGRCRIYVDLGCGNLMCGVPGLYYNSGAGWRIEAAQEARGTKDKLIWTDGTGAERVFTNGVDDDGLGFICRVGENEIRICDRGGNSLIFSEDGRIHESELAVGGLRYAYTGGRLTAVEGYGARRVFAYDMGKLAVLAGDGVVFYEYVGDMLASVRFGDVAPGVKFEYREGLLASVMCGNERVDVEYDGLGRVRRINGAEYAYFEGYTVVRDGGEWRYLFDGAGRCTGATNGERIWKMGCPEVSIRDALGI